MAPMVLSIAGDNLFSKELENLNMLPKRAESQPNSGGLRDLPPDDVLFGQTPTMELVRRRAEKICKADVPLLLMGPAGSGKELVARWVHAHSASSGGQFVKVNCAAIPGSLLESELFGYEKGSFTGANTSKPGRVELADKGTLFLDEIGDLSSELQSKLLHFLQDGHFSRIGGEVEKSVETRLICTSNKDLEREVEAQRFRADLFYRISVVQIKLPSLYERRDDIPMVAEYLKGSFEQQFERKSEPFGPEMLEYFRALPWPGNMREFANEIARHVLVGPDAEATRPAPQVLAGAVRRRAKSEKTLSLKHVARDAIREMERSTILQALQNNRWNRRKAAQALKISYRALIYKIRESGIAPTRQKQPPLNPQE
jgi:two-component system, NtrC family, response regulator AtoC